MGGEREDVPCGSEGVAKFMEDARNNEGNKVIAQVRCGHIHTRNLASHIKTVMLANHIHTHTHTGV